jgi:hypothetical protein
MHAFRITVGMSVAALAMATSACGDLPTTAAADASDPVSAVAVSFNSQSRVPVCHRAANGEYIKITVADAAYATHMAHGDIAVGPAGGCGATSRLTLTVSGGWSGSFVTVTIAPETRLDDCLEGETCYYDVPTGATVELASNYWYDFSWSSGGCYMDSCVMHSDISVRAYAY